MVAIVLVEAPTPPRPGVPRERRHKDHRPVPDALEWLVLDLAGAHRSSTTTVFEHLNVQLVVGSP